MQGMALHQRSRLWSLNALRHLLQARLLLYVTLAHLRDTDRASDIVTGTSSCMLCASESSLHIYRCDCVVTSKLTCVSRRCPPPVPSHITAVPAGTSNGSSSALIGTHAGLGQVAPQNSTAVEDPATHGAHTRGKTFLTREALEQLPRVTLHLGRLDAAYLAKVGQPPAGLTDAGAQMPLSLCSGWMGHRPHGVMSRPGLRELTPVGLLGVHAPQIADADADACADLRQISLKPRGA